MKGTFGVVALSCILLACTTGPDSDDPPDNRGLLVATVDAVAIEWATDGTELYIMNANGTEILAVPALGGTTRTVHAGALLTLRSMRVAAGKVYVLTCTSGIQASCQVLRIDPSTPTSAEPILTRQGFGVGFAISSDGRFVALSDTIYDVTSSTRRALPAGNAVSFSPNGSHLVQSVAVTNTTTGLQRVATADFSVSSLTDAADIVGRYTSSGPVHFWTASNPQFVRADSVLQELRVSVLDGLSGSSIEITRIPKPRFLVSVLIPGDAMLDGRTIALWVGPLYDWSQLYAFDPERHTSAIVATVSGNRGEYPTVVRLSPDGTRAAYIVRLTGDGNEDIGKVYVASVTP